MSGVLLGSEFAPLPLPPAPPPPDPLAARLDLVLGALADLHLSLSNLPAPQVHLDAPDLSAVVNAVNGLKPSVGAEEIAAAVRDALTPTLAVPQQQDDTTLTALGEVLQKLEFRLRAAGSHTAAITLPNDPTRQLGHTTVDNFPATYDVPDRSARLLGHVQVDPGSYVSDTFAAKIGQGKARIGGQQVTTGVATPSAYFTVENPAANSRVVYVVGFDCYIDTGSATVNYRTGGTTPNASVGTLFNPNMAVSAASSAIVRAGLTAPTGATLQPIASRIVSGAPLKIQQLVVLPPGGVFGIQVIGAAAGANIAANAFLYEE